MCKDFINNLIYCWKIQQKEPHLDFMCVLFFLYFNEMKLKKEIVIHTLSYLLI